MSAPESPDPAALLAPDSFKGSLSAGAVADALGDGFEHVGIRADRCPMADGGEGTLDALRDALRLESARAEVHDALGRPLEACYGFAASGEVAIVETAAAIGIAQIDEDERDPEAATSAGAGELILAAAQRAPLVLVALGGSASNDGGRGAVEAIGAAGGLGSARLVCLCDVRTPWELASATFGPQKGADAAAVGRLEQRLDALAAELPRDPRGVPMTGAAGGLAGGLWAAFGAELVRRRGLRLRRGRLRSAGAHCGRRRHRGRAARRDDRGGKGGGGGRCEVSPATGAAPRGRRLGRER